MGTIAEVLSDDKGLVWPKDVSPYQVHIVAISGGNSDVSAEADRLYDILKENGIDALYDDRDVRAGEKFADADLLGIPTRLVVSERTVAEGGIEVSMRAGRGSALVPDSSIIEHLKKK